MVATEPGVGTTTTDATDGGTTFGKLKQTLSSSLLTAQDKGKTYFHLISHYPQSNPLILAIKPIKKNYIKYQNPIGKAQNPVIPMELGWNLRVV